MKQRTAILVFVLFACLISDLGCSKKLIKDLDLAGIAYLSYIDKDKHREGPPGWDEFIAYSQKDRDLGPNYSAAIRRVRDEGYKVKWKVRLDAVRNPNEEVLFEHPTDGPCLMLDCSLRK